MLKFTIWLLAAFGIAFLIPIPGCLIPALIFLGSVTVGLLIAQ